MFKRTKRRGQIPLLRDSVERGMVVHDIGGRTVGKVADLRRSSFLLERPTGLLWMSASAVLSVGDAEVVLVCTVGTEDRYRVAAIVPGTASFMAPTAAAMHWRF